VIPELYDKPSGGENGLSMGFKRIMERARIDPGLIRQLIPLMPAQRQQPLLVQLAAKSATPAPAGDGGHSEVHGEFSHERRPGHLVQLLLKDFVGSVGINPKLDRSVPHAFQWPNVFLD
jgi:hypothetical protein